jgi:two-component system CheB/CheR fusion protein
VKNTLAIAQAIVSHTLRSAGATEAVQESVIARLQAVGKSHDLLLSSDWNGAELGALAREQLAAHLEVQRPRVHLFGPPVHLPPQAATAFGLLVHELATNAAKYGALSNDTGTVRVTWIAEPAETGRRVRLTWQEQGGPTVVPPARKGFGSLLLEQALKAELGSASLSFAPDGVECVVELVI